MYDTQNAEWLSRRFRKAAPPLHFIRSRLVLSSFGTLLEEGTDGELNAQIE